MAVAPVTRRTPAGNAAAPASEGPAQPVTADTRLVADLSEAIDALLGILAVMQDSGMLPPEVDRVLTELVDAAQRASAALAGVLGEMPAGEEVPEEGEYRPAKPVLKVPVRAGGQRNAVSYATTPNFGLTEE